MFETSLKYAKSCLDIKFDLSANQTSALKSLFQLQDTVVVMPTGSGKSVIFQLLPWLLQKKMELAKPITKVFMNAGSSLGQWDPYAVMIPIHREHGVLDKAVQHPVSHASFIRLLTKSNSHTEKYLRDSSGPHLSSFAED